MEKKIIVHPGCVRMAQYDERLPSQMRVNAVFVYQMINDLIENGRNNSSVVLIDTDKLPVKLKGGGRLEIPNFTGHICVIGDYSHVNVTYDLVQKSDVVEIFGGYLGNCVSEVHNIITKKIGARATISPVGTIEDYLSPSDVEIFWKTLRGKK